MQKAHDSVKDEKVDLATINLSRKPADTGNLRERLLVKVGARVMLTNNIDTCDGLTNGAYGTVTYIVTRKYTDGKGNEKEDMRSILVHFDREEVGLQAKAKSLYRNIDPLAVPIHPIDVRFFHHGYKTVEITRRNFPLCLAWAVTIHKVQGMTVDEIVVDMSPDKGVYDNEQAYVALSRVTSYEKLHIVNYNRHQIRTSEKVHKEME